MHFFFFKFSLKCSVAYTHKHVYVLAILVSYPFRKLLPDIFLVIMNYRRVQYQSKTMNNHEWHVTDLRDKQEENSKEQPETEQETKETEPARETPDVTNSLNELLTQLDSLQMELSNQWETNGYFFNLFSASMSVEINVFSFAIWRHSNVLMYACIWNVILDLSLTFWYIHINCIVHR